MKIKKIKSSWYRLTLTDSQDQMLGMEENKVEKIFDSWEFIQNRLKEKKIFCIDNGVPQNEVTRMIKSSNGLTARYCGPGGILICKINIKPCNRTGYISGPSQGGKLLEFLN